VPRPLPMEFRTRVVETYLDGDSMIDEIAARFKVGSATLKRWVAAFRAVGHVQPRPMGGKRHEYLISPEGEKFLAEFLFVVPDSTLPELVNHDEAAYGVRVSDYTMGPALHRMGLSKKAVRRAPATRTPVVIEAQAAFEAGIAALNSDSLVLTDEAGYSTALNFSTAWSKVGEPAVVIAPTRSPNLMVMGAIANGGPWRSSGSKVR
jgi:transposase